MGHILRVHRRVHGDPRQIALLQRPHFMCHPQALLQQDLQLVAVTLACVRQPRALVWEGVLKKLFADEVLEIAVVNPALAQPSSESL